MKAFVFDTETTGMIVKGGSKEEQPYIIQFAGILGEVNKNDGFKEVEKLNFLVKPRISIPFLASQIHGIYDKDVENSPYIEDMIDKILKYLNTTDVIVAHNIEFDEEVIKGELARLNRIGEYQPIKKVCTMRSSTDFCQLQGRGFSYKPPKLNELYLKLFGERFTGGHDALADTEATAKAFGELVKKGVIKIEENRVMRLF